MQQNNIAGSKDKIVELKLSRNNNISQATKLGKKKDVKGYHGQDNPQPEEDSPRRSSPDTNG